MRSFFIRLGLSAAIVGAAAYGGHRWAAQTLPEPGALAAGVTIDGRRPEPGHSAADLAQQIEAELLDAPLTVVLPDETTLATTARELGATTDAQAVAERAMQFAREGDLTTRLAEAVLLNEEPTDLAVRLRLPAGPLAERLQIAKDHHDHGATPARRLANGDITPHAEGAYIDAYATAQAVESALRAGEASLAAAVFAEVPAASTDVARELDVSTLIAFYETRFSGSESGRAKNVRRAASLIDGTLLMPGEAVSFNRIVGARSVENGFFPAPEIYRGEMREGIGGGTCQVASTLYAAAFFGAIDIVERVNHSRPSKYIPLGLDAAVSYPVLDLKLMNPYAYPMVIHASVDGPVLRFELRGAEDTADVSYRSATISTHKYKRKIRKTSFLGEGEHLIKQAGRRGVKIKRFRVLTEPDGGERIEESIDFYPPTNEVVLVAPDVDPDEDLPPLPDA